MPVIAGQPLAAGPAGTGTATADQDPPGISRRRTRRRRQEASTAAGRAALVSAAQDGRRQGQVARGLWRRARSHQRCQPSRTPGGRREYRGPASQTRRSSPGAARRCGRPGSRGRGARRRRPSAAVPAARPPARGPGPPARCPASWGWAPGSDHPGTGQLIELLFQGAEPGVISRMPAGLHPAVTADHRRRGRDHLHEHQLLPGADPRGAGHHQRRAAGLRRRAGRRDQVRQPDRDRRAARLIRITLTSYGGHRCACLALTAGNRGLCCTSRTADPNHVKNAQVPWHLGGIPRAGTRRRDASSPLGIGSGVKNNARGTSVTVSADGRGLVSQAGAVLL